MAETDWEVVSEVYGEIQGELLRGLLEAQGIPVILNQEGAGRAYGINVGPLGQVQILVPARFKEQAGQILEDYYSGAFEEEDGGEVSEDE
jgi:hypothetical protein